MKYIIVLISLALTSFQVFAQQNRNCLIESGLIGFQNLSWEQHIGGEAILSDHNGEVFSGSLTRSTPHGDGKKLNFKFELSEAYQGKIDVIELMIWPAFDKIKVGGAGYVKEHERLYLHYFYPAVDAHCSSQPEP